MSGWLVCAWVVTQLFTYVDLAWTADTSFIVGDHFAPLCDPTWETTQGEQRGEHPVREAHRAVDQARVEVDVRVQFALDEVVVVECALFDAHCHFETFVVATKFIENLLCGGFHDACAWIIVFVDTVTQANQ